MSEPLTLPLTLPLPLSLREVQRLVHASITRADPTAARLVRSGGDRSAEQRLRTYHRSHHLRLHGALRSLFPALLNLLGPEVFDEFAADFVAAAGSTSYSLAHLGPRFLRHLEATRDPADTAWSQPIVDLAALEVLFREVYDAVGGEGRELPGGSDLPDAPDGSWCVHAVPTVRLFRAGSTVDDYVAAVHAGRPTPPPAPVDCRVLVHRKDYGVTLTRLDADEFDLLHELVAGRRFADAAAVAGIDPAAARDLVARRADDGCFSHIVIAPNHGKALS